jgi:hypothetical protein
MLKSSPNPIVLIGKDDWLFYANPVDGNPLEDYRRNDPLTPTELRSWKTALEAKYMWLKQRDIQYLFVIAPNKHTIYGEYIPSRIRQVGKQTRLDQLLEYMHDSEVPILDLRPPMLQAKTKGLLYYKTDTHWNNFGAAVAQYEIIRHLLKYYRTLYPIDYSFVDFSLVEYTGDMANMLNLSSHFKEMAFQLWKQIPLCNLPIVEEQPKTPNPPFITNCCAGAPRALIFGDSFLTALQPYISQYFAKSLYVRNYPDFHQLEQYTENYTPDIVIEERVERYLNKIPTLPTAKNKAYHVFFQRWFQTGVIVYQLAEHHQDELTPIHQLAITPAEQGYTLLSQGNDPHFLLPEFKTNEVMQYIMKIVINAPQATNWQIFYGTLLRPQYNEEQSISGQLQSGENTFYVVLDDQNLDGKIRIDPGSVMGEYTLKSLEIRAVKRQ